MGVGLAGPVGPEPVEREGSRPVQKGHGCPKAEHESQRPQSPRLNRCAGIASLWSGEVG